ncbi:hypothetical protein [Kitasatospora sp. NPDC051914]|uniref:hypothetical protein n=1 Tax=Kitasatospora sp. NPDC051914 TaxID=3154945 RepID=UPI003447D1E4
MLLAATTTDTGTDPIAYIVVLLIAAGALVYGSFLTFDIRGYRTRKQAEWDRATERAKLRDLNYQPSPLPRRRRQAPPHRHLPHHLRSAPAPPHRLPLHRQRLTHPRSQTAARRQSQPTSESGDTSPPS